PIDGNSVGLVETGAGGRATISRIPGLPAAGDCRDDLRGSVDPTNAVVEGIRKIEIAIGIKADIERPVQQRPHGWPPIPAIAALTSSHSRRDDPGLICHRPALGFSSADLNIAIAVLNRSLLTSSASVTCDVRCSPSLLARLMACARSAPRSQAFCGR